MDTTYDFVSPEFFHILFFKQHNLIIYPYVDLKHLIPLEGFLIGYNLEYLDGTALYNLSEIIEYSSIPSHNQNPTFYIITNVNREEIKNLVGIKNIHCIINTKDIIIDDLIPNTNFIIYNKKKKSFLNYDFDKIDLSFEIQIIQNSASLEFLFDEVQSIKNLGNKIYLELNRTGKIEKIHDHLSEVDSKHHNTILEFVSNYYNVVLPGYNPKLSTTSEIMKQYKKIQMRNPKIFSIFRNLLQDYKKNFDDKNLSNEQLFPEKFFVYLKKHQWRDNIFRSFLSDWYYRFVGQMNPIEQDYSDFKWILTILNIPESEINILFNEKLLIKNKMASSKIDKDNTAFDFNSNDHKNKEIPSINNIDEFEEWIIKKLDKIDLLLDTK